MERDSFVFYRSFYEGIKELPRDIQGEVLTAIMEYGLNGATTDNLKPVARAIFTLIKPQLDANNKRFESGKKGGRPKKKDNQTKTKVKPNQNQNITKVKPKDNQEITKPKPNVNVNVNDNVNDNVNIPPNPLRGKKEEIDFDKLLDFINENFKKKLRVFSDKAKRQIKARLKEGYTREVIRNAIVNASRDTYHKDSDFKWINPEYFGRAKTLDMYGHEPTEVKPKPKNTPAYGVYDV